MGVGDFWENNYHNFFLHLWKRHNTINCIQYIRMQDAKGSPERLAYFDDTSALDMHPVTNPAEYSILYIILVFRQSCASQEKIKKRVLNQRR